MGLLNFTSGLAYKNERNIKTYRTEAGKDKFVSCLVISQCGCLHLSGLLDFVICLTNISADSPFYALRADVTEHLFHVLVTAASYLSGPLCKPSSHKDYMLAFYKVFFFLYFVEFIHVTKG